MADWSLLRRLCNTPGVSGAEEQVREIILEEIRPYADSIEITPLGNLIAVKKGRERARKKLMLDAHMDEVGFLVTFIREDGLLKMTAAGGINLQVMAGRPVAIDTVHGLVPGVIGAKPIHLLDEEERGKAVPLKDLYIDIGAASREEAAALVSPGDRVVFRSVWDESHGRLKARALDDRAGWALLVDLMKKDLQYDMTFVFAVQEETGQSGSRTAAHIVAPDAAIVVEATTAGDSAGVPEEKRVCSLGKGPVVTFMDHGAIYDRDYYRLAFEAAAEAGVPCQSKLGVAGGNDARVIHASGEGVRPVSVSLPCRYIHSAVGMISQQDYHDTLAMLQRLAEKIAGGEPAAAE